MNIDSKCGGRTSSIDHEALGRNDRKPSGSRHGWLKFQAIKSRGPTPGRAFPTYLGPRRYRAIEAARVAVAIGTAAHSSRQQQLPGWAGGERPRTRDVEGTPPRRRLVKTALALAAFHNNMT